MRHPFSRAVLMTPGPVEEALEHRLAAFAWTTHHRTPAFEELFLRVQDGVRWLAGASGPVALLTSSGSGGLEAAVTNLLAPGEAAVTVEAGKFGARWGRLVEAHGGVRHALTKEPGEAASPEELRARVDEVGAQVAFTTLQETSTGVRHDIQGFGRALEGTGCLLVVDAVSGLGAVPLEVDAWGVDLLVAGSQKGLLSPPGLALCTWSERAGERMTREGGARRFYFDLARYAKDPARAPFTPPTPVVAQLDAVLASLRDVGKARVMEAVATAAAATVAAGRAMRMEPLASDRDRTPGLTALRVPEGVDGSGLVAEIEGATGCRVAGGQDALKGRIVRIGHMGASTPGDLLACVAALEAALARRGHAGPPGAGVAACAAVLFPAGEGTA